MGIKKRKKNRLFCLFLKKIYFYSKFFNFLTTDSFKFYKDQIQKVLKQLLKNCRKRWNFSGMVWDRCFGLRLPLGTY